MIFSPVPTRPCATVQVRTRCAPRPLRWRLSTLSAPRWPFSERKGGERRTRRRATAAVASPRAAKPLCGCDVAFARKQKRGRKRPRTSRARQDRWGRGARKRRGKRERVKRVRRLRRRGWGAEELGDGVLSYRGLERGPADAVSRRCSRGDGGTVLVGVRESVQRLRRRGRRARGRVEAHRERSPLGSAPRGGTWGKAGAKREEGYERGERKRERTTRAAEGRRGGRGEGVEPRRGQGATRRRGWEVPVDRERGRGKGAGAEVRPRPCGKGKEKIRCKSSPGQRERSLAKGGRESGGGAAFLSGRAARGSGRGS